MVGPVLLFVLWYCHKRGREVRLENERLVTEGEIQKLNEETPGEPIRPTETILTTAPQGASVRQVREGVQEAQQTQGPAIAADEQERETANRASTMTLPTRSRSMLSMWTRSHRQPSSTTKIEPYPGT